MGDPHLGQVELRNSVFMRFEEHRKKNTSQSVCTRITEPFPVLSPSDIDYGTFYEEYLIKNRPCLILSSITDDWNCRNDWIDRSSVFPQIDFDFLQRTYGELWKYVTKVQTGI